ncbi:hypothetical protein V6C03_13210 [Methyloligella sp. 2.7D]|uniref:hypothetical protein n=1 Tax=unclassified Methyloligella TaxID=2625955 RepID=UPI00157DB04B|nr:hypothetical protein [Methyloligella sp. GL2]QKP77267.1 hypothetical protein HT051_07255 [Methyloligella sp. GL2]
MPDEHSITVDGKYGTPSAVSGRVRLGPHGYQVQTPGGAWLNCTFNCAYTLRNATVDFWHRDDAPGGG